MITPARATLASLGEVTQLAYVPRDIDAALRFWTQSIGAGPFFRNPRAQVEDVTYYGRPSDVEFRTLIGYWGDLQIELVEQLNDAPSIYKDWLDGGFEGLHHVCILVEDMKPARAAGMAAGARSAMEGRIAGGQGEFIYFDTGGGPGSMVEIVRPGPALREAFAMMREASRGWDGSDPVRSRGT